MRVLKWIVDRVHGRGYAAETPLGWVPRACDLDLTGLEAFGRDGFEEAMIIHRDEWRHEVLLQEELFEKLYDRLPKEFFHMRQLLLSSLWRSPADMGLAPER
jgi:phosphoenolpyruvate carboxykinase (GTP)